MLLGLPAAPSSTYPTTVRSAQRNLSKSIEEAAQQDLSLDSAYHCQDQHHQSLDDDFNIFPTITRPVITQVSTDHQQRRHMQQQQQQHHLQSQQQKLSSSSIEDDMVSSVGLMVCSSDGQTLQRRRLTGDSTQDSNDSNQTITLTRCTTGSDSVGTTANALAKKSGLRNDVNFVNCAIDNQSSSQHTTLITGSSTSSSSANSSSVSSPQHDSYESVATAAVGGAITTTAATTTSAGGQTLQQQQQEHLHHQHSHQHHQQQLQEPQHHQHLMASHSSDVTNSPQLSSHIVTTNSNCGSNTTTGVRNALISDTVNLSPTPYNCKYKPPTHWFHNLALHSFSSVSKSYDRSSRVQFDGNNKTNKQKIKSSNKSEIVLKNGIMLDGSSFCDLRYSFAAYDYSIKRKASKCFHELAIPVQHLRAFPNNNKHRLF